MPASGNTLERAEKLAIELSSTILRVHQKDRFLVGIKFIHRITSGQDFGKTDARGSRAFARSRTVRIAGARSRDSD